VDAPALEDHAVTAPLLAVAWAAIVAVPAWRHRPRPARIEALTGRATRGRIRSNRLRSMARVFARLPIVAPVVAIGSVAFHAVRARRSKRVRLSLLVADLAEVVDLFVLAVGAGLTVPLAIVAVGERATGPLGAELRRALDEVARGRRLTDALDDVPGRTCDAVRPLIAALVASERYGAPVALGLERLSVEVRHEARRRAEAAARRVPVKLLFPLVSCSLPAFALLTVAPLIAGTLGSLRL
jgi:tight adherence protein C